MPGATGDEVAVADDFAGDVLGGALPGVGTMAIFGAMRYTNVVIAADEDGLPPGRDPPSVDVGGAKRGENAESLYIATGATNIVRRGVAKDTPEDEDEQGLRRAGAKPARPGGSRHPGDGRGHRRRVHGSLA